MTSAKKLGLAIIGYGRFADKWITGALRRSQAAHLVAVHARTREISGLDVPIYRRVDALLADPNVHAVYVTSANQDHEQHVCAALDAKKHVLCEKPMAPSPAACRRMIMSARANRRYLAVGHMLRFSPVLIRMKELSKKPDFGELLYARADIRYRANPLLRSWICNQEVAGGGVLLDAGIHALDILRDLFEGEPIEASSVYLNSEKQHGLETAAVCLLTFPRRAFAVISANSDAPYGSSLEIIGQRGRIWAEGFARCTGQVRIVCELENGNSIHRTEESIDVAGVFERQIDWFCHMAEHDFHDSWSADNGLQNVEIVHRFYRVPQESSAQ